MPVMMPLREPFTDAVDGQVLPKIITLGPDMYGLAFHLMKLLPARFIVSRAIERGELAPGATVAETTSGTFGLGLAMECRVRGYPLILVGDPVIDGTLRNRLEALGARVSIVPRSTLRTQDVQQARLERLARIRSRLPSSFVPRQYDNPDNPASYGVVAELLLESLGMVDALVCPVGSGGSSCGIGSFLRALSPDLQLVGVDTPGSILFAAPEGPRPLRGLGSGIIPRVLDHRLFDEVHWLPAAQAFAATRRLHAEHCLFMGPTSGAAYHVARWYARSHPGARVVVVFPDEGHRYARTVYNTRWLDRHRLLTPPVETPRTVAHPSEVRGAWTRIAWNRRSRDEVAGSAPRGVPA
ncbi:cysteine synthase family protein [Actinomadura macra]|uniref:cysteine synthase family protein n=1 Tax=Actinomadura macra TaxID=46164 RepID=UPI000A728CD7|nr:cysteine synthase family protein [Actinomadura macra]